MMKLFVAVLLAMIAAVTIEPSQAAVACFKHWTRAQAGKSGTYTYTGITNGTNVENYNNPLWYSAAAAQKGFSSSNPTKGRLSAALPTSTYMGPMTFDFFAKKDQIKITFTKSTGKGTITSGKGCYDGITGTATRVQVGTSLPKVFEWTFCPKVAPKCKPT
jgi:hypothetical protein